MTHLHFNPETKPACPKCGNTSGNDWSQCKGVCPMAQSPHYAEDWEELAAKGYKDFPLSDWQYEVANGDTKLGYENWYAHRKEAEEDEVVF